MKSKFESCKWYWCTTPPSLGMPNKMGFYLPYIIEGNCVGMWSNEPSVFVLGVISDKGIIAKDEKGNVFHFLSHHVYDPEKKGLDRFGVER